MAELRIVEGEEVTTYEVDDYAEAVFRLSEDLSATCSDDYALKVFRAFLAEDPHNENGDVTVIVPADGIDYEYRFVA